MTSEINTVQGNPEDIHNDLVVKAARFGAFGWLAFFIVLVILVLQNIIYALKPINVLASENGVVVGQVEFNEPRIRHIDTITADLKIWVSRCTSINKLTIYEDLAVCLRHMDEHLSEEKLRMYDKTEYGPYVENFGCQRTEVSFDAERQSIARDKSKYWVEAEFYGKITCNMPGAKSTHQDFSISLVAMLTGKSTTNILGFKVSEFRDIE